MSDERLEDIATLGQSPLLSALPVEDIGALLELLETSGGPAGAVLACEGEIGDGLSFVLEGQAKVERRGAELGRLVAGDCFGELSLAGPGPHPTTVTALTEVRLARLTRPRFEALGRVRPATALHVATALLARTADALARATAPASGSASRRPPGRPEVTARVAGARATAPPGRRVADVVPRDVDGALVVGAMLDHLAVPLDAPLTADATVAPLTTAHWEGREIYRRTAGLVLLEAARRAGVGPIRLGPSITSGRVVLVDAAADRPLLARDLGRALAEIVLEDVPLGEEIWRVDEAVQHFVEQGWDDAVALLDAWHEASVTLVRCGDVVALSPGPTLPSAGRLAGVEVLPHPNGLLLDFGPAIRRELPRRPYSTRVMEMRAPRFGAEMSRREQDWLELLGATSVGRFNRACVSGQVKELIHVSEGFHEKRIAILADEITAKSGVRIIAIAGPSSSGKTTFIKRLKIQLEVNGIHPLEVSLDDYYVDRDKSPRDAAGEYDFEALEALDLGLLDDHTARLLAGEAVRTARYDFHTGKSHRDGGPELRLAAHDVLLVEGIHALNPSLFGDAVSECAFRIFVHPATTLPFDRLSALEPADVRLVRRVVRDRHQRGYGAGENLSRWPSVRRGERLHIYPFQGNADAVFDSALVYEPSVLKVYAERYLLEVPRAHPEFSAAHRLRRLLAPFVPIHPDHVPPTSILREFIGGSGFSY